MVVSLGCGGGAQSALRPAGRGAEDVAALFGWMAAGAAIIWLIVVGAFLYAMRTEPGEHGRRAGTFIIGGGVLFPTLVLAALLSYGLSLLPPLLAPAPPGSLAVVVTGERWWWRVRYEPPGREPFELANEIRLPVGEPVQFHLESADVIHSFWIPSLGGKMDMFPGRRTHLALHPTRTGRFRGACAEYCGGAHALMNFWTVVQEPAEFEDWMDAQAQPARSPEAPLAARGAALFLANGCGACHTVRGTEADGVVGPDLTHVASRVSIGAAVLPTELEAFRRWVAHTETVKPRVRMPAFGMLPAEDLRALAAYLEALE